MSSSLRRLERSVVKHNSKGRDFHEAWEEFRQKKWNGNPPRDTNKKKLHFFDNQKILSENLKFKISLKEAFMEAITKKYGKKDATAHENKSDN